MKKWIIAIAMAVVIAVVVVVNVGPRTLSFRNDQLAFSSEIRKASQVVVYEGLPHGAWESKLLQAELKKNVHFMLHGFPFYKQPLAISPEELNGVTEVFSTSKAFSLQEPGTMKMCGGFHPDAAVEWTTSGGKHLTLICLGCGDLHLRGALTYDCELGESAAETMRSILKQHRQNRPLSKYNKE